jgi:hypothetical protein
VIFRVLRNNISALGSRARHNLTNAGQSQLLEWCDSTSRLTSLTDKALIKDNVSLGFARLYTAHPNEPLGFRAQIDMTRAYWIVSTPKAGRKVVRQLAEGIFKTNHAPL